MKTVPTINIAMHYYHDTLFSRVYNANGIKTRIASIKQYKPEPEQEVRLKLIKLVPSSKFPPKLKAIAKEYSKLGKEPRFDNPAWNEWGAKKVKLDHQIENFLYSNAAHAMHKACCVAGCPWSPKNKSILTEFDKVKGKYKLREIKPRERNGASA